ncbi:MAG: hypothetical protein HY538_00935 [Deltaproteobacteria bacterium]|nr:hypothetical protein [Deltaproteobacteria bacterium]
MGARISQKRPIPWVSIGFFSIGLAIAFWFQGCGGCDDDSSEIAESLSVSDVDPACIKIDTLSTLSIQGSGFSSDMVVEFQSGELSMNPTSESLVSSQELNVEITCPGEGAYDLTIVNGTETTQKSGILECALECESSPPGPIVSTLTYVPQEGTGGTTVRVIGTEIGTYGLQVGPVEGGELDPEYTVIVERTQKVLDDLQAKFTLPENETFGGVPGGEVTLGIQWVDANGEVLQTEYQGETLDYLEFNYTVPEDALTDVVVHSFTAWATCGDVGKIQGTGLKDLGLQIGPLQDEDQDGDLEVTNAVEFQRKELLAANWQVKFKFDEDNCPSFLPDSILENLPEDRVVKLGMQLVDENGNVADLTGGTDEGTHGDYLALDFQVPLVADRSVSITNYTNSGTYGTKVKIFGSDLSNLTMKVVALNSSGSAVGEYVSVTRDEKDWASKWYATFEMPSFDDLGSVGSTLTVAIGFFDEDGDLVDVTYDGQTKKSLSFTYTIGDPGVVISSFTTWSTCGEWVEIAGVDLGDFGVRVGRVQNGVVVNPVTFERKELLLKNFHIKIYFEEDNCPDFLGSTTAGETLDLGIELTSGSSAVGIKDRSPDYLPLTFRVPDAEAGPSISITRYTSSGTEGDTVKVVGTGLKDLSVELWVLNSETGDIDETSVTRTELLLPNLQAKFEMPSFNDYGDAGETVEVHLFFFNEEGEQVDLTFEDADGDGNKDTQKSLPFSYQIPPESGATISSYDGWATCDDLITIEGSSFQGLEVQIGKILSGVVTDPVGFKRREILWKDKQIKVKFDDKNDQTCLDFLGDSAPGETIEFGIQLIDSNGDPVNLINATNEPTHGDYFYLYFRVPDEDPIDVVPVLKYEPTRGSAGDKVKIVGSGLKDLEVEVWAVDSDGNSQATPIEEREEADLLSNYVIQFTMSSLSLYDETGEPGEEFQAGILFFTAEGDPVHMEYDDDGDGVAEARKSLHFTYVIPPEEAIPVSEYTSWATCGDYAVIEGTGLKGLEVRVGRVTDIAAGNTQALIEFEQKEILDSNSKIKIKFDEGNCPDFLGTTTPGETLDLGYQLTDEDGDALTLTVGEGTGNYLPFQFKVPEEVIVSGPSVTLDKYEPTSGTGGDQILIQGRDLKDLVVKVVTLDSSGEWVGTVATREENVLLSNRYMKFAMPSFDVYGDPLETIDVRIVFCTDASCDSAEEQVDIKYDFDGDGETEVQKSLLFEYSIPISLGDLVDDLNGILEDVRDRLDDFDVSDLNEFWEDFVDNHTKELEGRGVTCEDCSAQPNLSCLGTFSAPNSSTVSFTPDSDC